MYFKLNFKYSVYGWIFRVLQFKIVAVVIVAHIYPPVTGQRQTLTCWTIRTLFITLTTS